MRNVTCQVGTFDVFDLRQILLEASTVVGQFLVPLQSHDFVPLIKQLPFKLGEMSMQEKIEILVGNFRINSKVLVGNSRKYRTVARRTTRYESFDTLLPQCSFLLEIRVEKFRCPREYRSSDILEGRPCSLKKLHRLFFDIKARPFRAHPFVEKRRTHVALIDEISTLIMQGPEQSWNLSTYALFLDQPVGCAKCDGMIPIGRCGQLNMEQFKCDVLDFNLFSLGRGHHVLFVNAVQTDTFIAIDNDDSRSATGTYKIPKTMCKKGICDNSGCLGRMHAIAFIEGLQTDTRPCL